MKNVTCKLVEGKLHIILDPAARLGVSASGKSVTVASTGGFVEVPECGLRLNLNAIVPAEKK